MGQLDGNEVSFLKMSGHNLYRHICFFSFNVLPSGLDRSSCGHRRCVVAHLCCPIAICRRERDPTPPTEAVKLIFIHHSTGQNWLADGNGGLGQELGENNYFVSDTNYGWGPDAIGDRTDIGNWWEWFRGPESGTYLSALYNESGQHSSYTRSSTDPGGENQVIMFKSCFPNSQLGGGLDDPVPAIEDNPLKGVSCGSQYHTIANAKGIYIDLLEYFKTRQDKLFVVIVTPPVQDPGQSANARALSQWLVDDWLDDYPYDNVLVFDFYNVLTSNGGSSDTNDLGRTDGNHHRIWNGSVQHKTR